jgi:hypothetical protein
MENRVPLYRAAETATKLNQTRETVRRFLGEKKYRVEIGAVCEIVKAVADSKGSDVLSVGLSMARKAEKDGKEMVALHILAATVELCEGWTPEKFTG